MIVKIKEGPHKGRVGKVLGAYGQMYRIELKEGGEVEAPIEGVKILKFISFLLELIIGFLDAKPTVKALGAAAAGGLESNSKKWYFSKTIWAALIALGATIAVEAAGIEIDAATQAAILSAIMIIFRLITKKSVSL